MYLLVASFIIIQEFKGLQVIGKRLNGEFVVSMFFFSQCTLHSTSFDCSSVSNISS